MKISFGEKHPLNFSDQKVQGSISYSISITIVHVISSFFSNFLLIDTVVEVQ
jgi:hypothetical protein